ncbi:LuxR C-terminal-related transcriptional regulator [Enterobacter hormaechei]
MRDPVSKINKQFLQTKIIDERIRKQAYVTLTKMELKVIEGLLRTQSVKICAKELSITEKYVSAHKVKALSKLGFTGVRDLIYFYKIIESVCGIKMKYSAGK